jgi:xylitol oxidase
MERDPAVVDSVWLERRGGDGGGWDSRWGGRRADTPVHPIIGIDPHAQTMEIRTIAFDDMWLSPFQGRETLAVHATWTSDFRSVRPALEHLEDIVRPFGSRPHWGKVFLDFDQDWVASTHPAMPRYRRLPERLDPERRFVNDLVEELGIR